MKGLKRIALVGALATGPLVAQGGGLQPLDDTQLGNVTGQAGVAIELQTELTIDQIAYNQGGDGSFLMDNIRVGGFSGASTLNLAMDIELQDSGDALISLDTLDELPVDMAIQVGAMGLSGNEGSATMMSNLDLELFVRHLDILAQVEDMQGAVDGTGSLHFDIDFVVNNMDLDFDVVAISLEGFRMGGVGSLETLSDPFTDNLQMAVLSDSNPARVDMTLGAGPAISGGRNGIAADDDVLRVDLDLFEADIWMPTINVGPNTVGNVGISELRVLDTQMAIYGYER